MSDVDGLALAASEYAKWYHGREYPAVDVVAFNAYCAGAKWQREHNSAERRLETAKELLRDSRSYLEFWTPDETETKEHERAPMNSYYAHRDRIDAFLAGEQTGESK